ncbi:cytochrome b5-related protein-like, partial [Chrysoperla carnea]|uniref:cytochrome b5-related protein-like n=1 Tax=Chrysoperla carnea TaxID=189513 RepID=UPI001D068BA8
MPPNSEKIAGNEIFNGPIPDHKVSYPELKYPSIRIMKKPVPDMWIKGKRLDDNAEGLWRVHNKLYDLSTFMEKHPGGKFWIETSQGTDITEAFESHHISSNAADRILPKYYVRDAKGPRNSPFTFEENGFYRTLKRKTAPILKELQRNHKKTTSVYISDLLLIGAYGFGIMSAMFQSYICALISALCLSMCTISAHNFFHQKDNFRMYYFNISLMSMSEWRITHVLSHHLFTNTLQDYEIIVVEPFLQYLPLQKSFFARYFPMVYSFIIYFAFFFAPAIVRTIRLILGEIPFKWEYLIGGILPTLMYLVSGASFLNVLFWFAIIICVASFHFAFVGLNAAHHHPHIFHEGDTPREDRDWGLGQLDAVMDRTDINGNQFLVLTNFGEHALHHLFPTVDHALLPKLLPVVKETMKEFNVELRMKSQLELIIGQFKQLIRIKPNDKPINYY